MIVEQFTVTYACAKCRASFESLVCAMEHAREAHTRDSETQTQSDEALEPFQHVECMEENVEEIVEETPPKVDEVLPTGSPRKRRRSRTLPKREVKCEMKERKPQAPPPFLQLKVVHDGYSYRWHQNRISRVAYR